MLRSLSLVAAIRRHPGHAKIGLGRNLASLDRKFILFSKAGEAVANEDTAPETIDLFLKSRKGKPSIPLKAKVGDTLLDVAVHNNINVDGTCDGELACSTCHCVLGDEHIRKMLPPCSRREEDLLQSAWGVEENSRLGCQVEVTRDMEGMSVSYPSANPGTNTSRQSTDNRKFLSKNSGLTPGPIAQKTFKIFTKHAIPSILKKYAPKNAEKKEWLSNIEIMANILPFRTNNYVLDHLINWSNIPNDPIFQLSFPQPGMLPDSEDLRQLGMLVKSGASVGDKRRAADVIRRSLNPHPAMQIEMNIPTITESEGIASLSGLQHKYSETVLFFPSESQYCHSYCTYCFRWPQFVGWEGSHFASNEIASLSKYLRQNKQVSDLLFTGGDPMVMKSNQLSRYLDAISSDPTLAHIRNIRIGSKSLAYWPYKFVTDADADDTLRLFERTVNAGKHVSFMAHFTHPVELSTPVVQEAISRIRSTGVEIRCQAPLVNHVNNDPDIWSTMWKEQVSLGMIPYYMFVERDTGARQWFGVPLSRALEVYQKASQKVSGLAKTVRGPSMSCSPGKIQVLGKEIIDKEEVFVLKFLQARKPDWTNRVFFADFDDKATWLDNLKPAFQEKSFFFEYDMNAMKDAALHGKGSFVKFSGEKIAEL